MIITKTVKGNFTVLKPHFHSSYLCKRKDSCSSNRAICLPSTNHFSLMPCISCIFELPCTSRKPLSCKAIRRVVKYGTGAAFLSLQACETSLRSVSMTTAFFPVQSPKHLTTARASSWCSRERNLFGKLTSVFS